MKMGPKSLCSEQSLREVGNERRSNPLVPGDCFGRTSLAMTGKL